MIKRKIARAAAGAVAGALAVLFLMQGESAADAAREALVLAAVRVIPSLFPYMVITSVIISLDLLSPFYRRIPTERLFGLPPSSASVMITGMAGGFPVGAVGACRLCEQGDISRLDAARLCALSLNASPAFILGTVGVMWGKDYARFLLSAQIITALTLGVLRRNGGSAAVDAPHGRISVPKQTAAGALCTAISDAAISSVGICGYMVFFKVTSSIIGAVLPQISDIVTVIFEFSAGAAIGAARGGLYGICLTGFAVGFAGFSVFMQTVSLTERAEIPFLPIFIRKLVTGVMLASLSAGFYLIYKPSEASAAVSLSPSGEIFPIILLLTVMLISAIALRRLSRSK